MKKWIFIISSIVLFLLLILFSLLIFLKNKGRGTQPDVESKTKGLMLLIEFEGTEGLVNFVDNIKERDIPALLVVSSGFVTENCNTINAILSYHDIEIAGVDASRPYWDIPYEEQLSVMKETKEKIEACTGKEIRVFGSKYFGYDENTIKAAQELGIEYVFARGTTGAKATVYKPKEYEVKIFSVSNVDSQKWGTGSLCDYSYWAREGRPEDFEKELFGALKYEKISPVSHTYIGGLKREWNDTYLKFFDKANVDWVKLDEFGKVDITSSYAEIPNNREVQYDTPHPAIPIEDEEDVSNPCAVQDLTQSSVQDVGEKDVDKIVIFHNGIGAMCLDALNFLEEKGYEYVEYKVGDEEFVSKFTEYREGFTSSEGVSEEFAYYPIIFAGDRAFSGFNTLIEQSLIEIME
ncbi:MAG: polysaccharide deacetylase family protein [Candidatus Dojkabacteria bacterium]